MAWVFSLRPKMEEIIRFWVVTRLASSMKTSYSSRQRVGVLTRLHMDEMTDA